MKTNSVHPPAFYYLALSFASGVIETGVLTAMFHNGQLGSGLTAATAYQLGCLARNPLGMSLRGAMATGGAGLVLALLFAGHTWALLLAVVLVSAAIQSARDAMVPKPAPVLAVKRTIRVIGFVAGILLGWYCGSHALLASVAGCVLPILLYGAMHSQSSALFSPNLQWNRGNLGGVMLFHQIHYFAYCYVLLFHLMRFPVAYIAGSTWNAPLHAAIWFGVGWATYIGGECVLRRVMCLEAHAAAIVGHLWVVACLIGMIACIGNPWGLSLCWALGGFGGGSVYAVKLLAQESACSINLELWENLGHVAGTGAAAMICLAWGERAGAVPYMIAICAATITLCGLWILPGGGKPQAVEAGRSGGAATSQDIPRSPSNYHS